METKELRDMICLAQEAECIGDADIRQLLQEKIREHIGEPPKRVGGMVRIDDPMELLKGAIKQHDGFFTVGSGGEEFMGEDIADLRFKGDGGMIRVTMNIDAYRKIKGIKVVR